MRGPCFLEEKDGTLFVPQSPGSPRWAELTCRLVPGLSQRSAMLFTKFPLQMSDRSPELFQDLPIPIQCPLYFLGWKKCFSFCIVDSLGGVKTFFFSLHSFFLEGQSTDPAKRNSSENIICARNEAGGPLTFKSVKIWDIWCPFFIWLRIKTDHL